LFAKNFNLSIPLNVENFDVIVIECDVLYVTNCEFPLNEVCPKLLFFDID
jgi:hypothetical protein